LCPVWVLGAFICGSPPARAQFIQQGLLNTSGTYGNGPLALSADGNTAIVGLTYANNGNGAGALVFTRTGGVWMQQQKLVGTGWAQNSIAQGYSVALSGDGNTAIVGGPGDNNNYGAAWVFGRNNNVWTQQGQKLVGTGGTPNATLQGSSVALSGDGNTAIVGGYEDNGFAGAAWVFEAALEAVLPGPSKA
jgi:hypothetical protein